MKDKLIQIRVDAEFLSKLEYLRHINGFKSIAETVRETVNKEWKKEEQIIHCIDCRYSHFFPQAPNTDFPNETHPDRWNCMENKNFQPLIHPYGFCDKAKRKW